MKISIIGPSGGGKSFLSRKMSRQFDLPRLEIDRLWFTCGGHDLFIKGGTEKEKDWVNTKIENEVWQFLNENKNWVIDGTYTKIQSIIADQADQIVFIKRPLLNRILSHLLRILKGEDRHPETGVWQDVKFSKTIVKRWYEKENQKLEEFVEKYKTKLVRLKSFKEINKYFDSLVE